MNHERINYEELCQTLFGTNDIEALSAIAKAVHCINPHGAGRKRMFTEAQVAEMQELQKCGVTITNIAVKYHTTRQTVGRYINVQPEPGYTLRLTLMHKNQPCTTIDVDSLGQQIQIQNKTNNIAWCAFGTETNPSWGDFVQFLQSRCPYEGSAVSQLQYSELLQIIQSNRGRVVQDDLWVRFQNF